jgi:hypothetical protein
MREAEEAAFARGDSAEALMDEAGAGIAVFSKPWPLSYFRRQRKQWRRCACGGRAFETRRLEY